MCKNGGIERAEVSAAAEKKLLVASASAAAGEQRDDNNDVTGLYATRTPCIRSVRL